MVRLIRYLNGTRQDMLYRSADDLHLVRWHIDAAFAVHPNFRRSHTGGVMTYGEEDEQCRASLASRSSTLAAALRPNW
jgi:hypothetical protein